jgi:hypothetical protein
MDSLEQTIHNIVSCQKTHGRFLNTLSFMESWGSQKISGVQRFCNGSKSILQHAAEEARHALFFKDLAMRIDGECLNSYHDEHGFSISAARRYLCKINLGVSRLVKGEDLDHPRYVWHCYLWVTLLIELRAMKIYGMYQKVQQLYGCKTSVKSIIREEVGHMEFIEQELSTLYGQRMPTILSKLADQESQYFEKLLGRWLSLSQLLTIEKSNVPKGVKKVEMIHAQV